MVEEAGEVVCAGAFGPAAAGVEEIVQREQQGLKGEDEQRRTHRAALHDAATYSEGRTEGAADVDLGEDVHGQGIEDAQKDRRELHPA